MIILEKIRSCIFVPDVYYVQVNLRDHPIYLPIKKKKGKKNNIHVSHIS